MAQCLSYENDALENMHKIIHEILDISARLRANYWKDLERSECLECGYKGVN